MIELVMIAGFFGAVALLPNKEAKPEPLRNDLVTNNLNCMFSATENQ